MAHKETAELIDEVLSRIQQAPGEELSPEELRHHDEVDSEKLHLLIDELEDQHLIELEEGKYVLTEKGYQTLEEGGVASLQTKNAQKELIPDFGSKMMQQLEDMMADEPNRKENFKKIKRTTFAWLFGLTLVGMFLAYLAGS